MQKIRRSHSVGLLATVVLCKRLCDAAQNALWKSRRALVYRVTIPQEEGIQDRIMQHTLKNHVHVTCLAEIEHASDSMPTTRPSVGVGPDVVFVV